MGFIILAGLSAMTYLVFLFYMIYKVFINISAKRSVLPSMSSVRRLHYEGVIYRFKFLMVATLLCASLTVVGFILGQVDILNFKKSFPCLVKNVKKMSDYLWIPIFRAKWKHLVENINFWSSFSLRNKKSWNVWRQENSTR